VLARASELGCGAILIDTFDKSAGPLDRHLSFTELARFIAAAKDQDFVCVVAGGLQAAHLEQILPLAPDYVGVRGAACRGNRAGDVDLDRVRALARRVRAARQRRAAALP
jgi:uncharacterized protein (UPF0264 family)